MSVPSGLTHAWAFFNEGGHCDPSSLSYQYIWPPWSPMPQVNCATDSISWTYTPINAPAYARLKYEDILPIQQFTYGPYQSDTKCKKTPYQSYGYRNGTGCVFTNNLRYEVTSSTIVQYSFSGQSCSGTSSISETYSADACTATSYSSPGKKWTLSTSTDPNRYIFKLDLVNVTIVSSSTGDDGGGVIPPTSITGLSSSSSSTGLAPGQPAGVGDSTGIDGGGNDSIDDETSNGSRFAVVLIASLISCGVFLACVIGGLLFWRFRAKHRAVQSQIQIRLNAVHTSNGDGGGERVHESQGEIPLSSFLPRAIVHISPEVSGASTVERDENSYPGFNYIGVSPD
jgi:hypothetical protein